MYAKQIKQSTQQQKKKRKDRNLQRGKKCRHKYFFIYLIYFPVHFMY